MKGYEHWFERFKRVLYAFKNGIIANEDLVKFQLFLLDTGQFNANFDLEELNYLGYPKSPFAMMHEKFYLREVETWAMQLLRFQYQERYADFGQLFPIFIDSNLFWNELQRYYRVFIVTQASYITDVLVLSLIKTLEETVDHVPIWVEVNKPNQDINVDTSQNLALKILEQKIIKLTARKQNIPETLVDMFISLNGEDQMYTRANELQVALEHLNQLFPEIRRNLKEKNDNYCKEFKASIDVPCQEFEPMEWRPTTVFGLCKKYNILPATGSTLREFKDLISKDPNAFKVLITKLISRLESNEPTIASYKGAINAWNQQNVDPLLARLFKIYYFRDNFNYIEAMVLCNVKEEPTFVHEAMEHLGYRIDPIRAQRIILQTYPKLFVDVEETAAFWEAINKTSMITDLTLDEEEKLKNPELCNVKLIEYEVINQLQQLVLQHIQSVPIITAAEAFSFENIKKLNSALPTALPDGFKFYAKYLKRYSEDYLRRYEPEQALRAVVDGEMKQILDAFLQDCIAGNISGAIRTVQNLSEIMLLDLSHNPLALTLPKIIQAQLNDLPVQGALVVPYGMRAFVRVFQLLDAQYEAEHFLKPLHVYVTSQSYFEWLDSLANLSKEQISVFQIQQIVDTHKSADIMFTELHPNNVLASKQIAFNIRALLSQMSSWPSKQRTLVIDMTLNAMNDQEIHDFLYSELSEALIKSGALNIILIQSLTKFAQLGLDKRSAGALTMINNNDKWSKVNARLLQLSEAEHIDISTLSFFSYFANMHWPEVEYLELINRNVRFVYQEIVDQTNKLELLHSGLQVSRSSDPKPCYVAINTNGFITDLSLKSDDFREFVSDLLIYLFYPLCHFYDLPISERYSIGFPLTSINPIFGSLRLTIGLEPEEQLKQYAEILAYLTFVFNDLRDERKLPLVRNSKLRRAFIADKLEIFKAMTPGKNIEYEWEYNSGSVICQNRPLKRKVMLKDGKIHFSAEMPEWTNLPAKVNKVSVNDSKMTIAEKRFVAGCFTAEYNIIIDAFEKTAHLENYNVIGLWNCTFLYGPFYCNDAELFCKLYQKKMYFRYNNQILYEKDIIVKQGTIETALSDMAIEDRAFLIREGYYPLTDRPQNYDMQLIPPNDKITMQFSLRENKLVIEHDFLSCTASGVNIYHRILDDQQTCYEIDYWDEKNPVVARFLRLITAIYVKDALSSEGVSFKARNTQFTHFVFNLNHEVINPLLQKAIHVISFYKESIRKALTKLTLSDEKQYLFYDSYSTRGRASWPSGYSPSGTDNISNADFIEKMLKILKS